MIRLAVAIAFVMPGLAQGPLPRLNDGLAAPLSPFALAKHIASHTDIDWNPVWKMLDRKDAPPSDLPRCPQPPDSLSCSRELITIAEPSQVILLLKTETPHRDFYLRFMERDSGWRFTGYHMAYRSGHETTTLWGKPFLKIAVDASPGTDIRNEIEEWFDLTSSRFDPVFSFPSEGSLNLWVMGISREFKSVASPTNQGGLPTIRLSVSVRFSFNGIDIGERELVGVYVKASAASGFSLHNAFFANSQSAIPLLDFRDLSDPLRSPSVERMLVYCLPGLKRVAIGSDAENKQSLKEMLDRCHDTAEKKSLQSLLGGDR